MEYWENLFRVLELPRPDRPSGLARGLNDVSPCLWALAKWLFPKYFRPWFIGGFYGRVDWPGSVGILLPGTPFLSAPGYWISPPWGFLQQRHNKIDTRYM